MVDLNPLIKSLSDLQQSLTQCHNTQPHVGAGEPPETLTTRQLETFFAIAYELGRSWDGREIHDTVSFYINGARDTLEEARKEIVDDGDWYEFIDKAIDRLLADGGLVQAHCGTSIS